MIKKYCRVILVALALTLVFLASAGASDYTASMSEAVVSATEGIYADAAVLYNRNTDEFVYSSNKDSRLPMASTTKIMTAIVALENSQIDSTVTMPKEAVGVEGSSVYLEAGEKMSLRDMLYALMLESANDAAEAIAIHTAGSVEAFVKLMNDKAQTLGLTNTHFENPHGLPDDNHYSSAGDMAKLFSYALDNPVFAEITAAKNHKVPLKSEGYRYFSNHNRLLGMIDGCIGGKTGYTKAAGRCLVSGTLRDGIYMICVTLNAGDDWNIHKRLTDYGYTLYENRRAAKAGEFSFKVPVPGGEVPYASVSNDEVLDICVKKSSVPITHTIELFTFYYPPVEAGDKAGRIVFRQNGKHVGEVGLYFENTVNIKPVKSFWERIFGKR